jgi:type IV secretory pathway TraG/TraD family ATPase VirD4
MTSMYARQAHSPSREGGGLEVRSTPLETTVARVQTRPLTDPDEVRRMPSGKVEIFNVLVGATLR